LLYIQRFILKELFAHKWSHPFQLPVDEAVVKDYYTVITHPMDLGSIRKRLKNGFYANAASCIADFEQMFRNCYTYNNSDHDVYKMGQELERIFRDRLQALPQPEMITRKYTPAPTKKSARTAANGTPMVAPLTLNAPIAVSSPEHHVASPQPTAAALKKERRASTRPVKVPSRDLPDTATKRRGPHGAQLRFCLQVIKELFNKKHEAYAWPFYKPVDVQALGLTDYFDLIKKPMDLGTVKDKIERGQYRNATEFAADFASSLPTATSTTRQPTTSWPCARSC